VKDLETSIRRTHFLLMAVCCALFIYDSSPRLGIWYQKAEYEAYALENIPGGLRNLSYDENVTFGNTNLKTESARVTSVAERFKGRFTVSRSDQPLYSGPRTYRVPDATATVEQIISALDFPPEMYISAPSDDVLDRAFRQLTGVSDGAQPLNCLSNIDDLGRTYQCQVLPAGLELYHVSVRDLKQPQHDLDALPDAVVQGPHEWRLFLGFAAAGKTTIAAPLTRIYSFDLDSLDTTRRAPPKAGAINGIIDQDENLLLIRPSFLSRAMRFFNDSTERSFPRIRDQLEAVGKLSPAQAAVFFDEKAKAERQKISILGGSFDEAAATRSGPLVIMLLSVYLWFQLAHMMIVLIQQLDTKEHELSFNDLQFSWLGLADSAVARTALPFVILLIPTLTILHSWVSALNEVNSTADSIRFLLFLLVTLWIGYNSLKTLRLLRTKIEEAQQFIILRKRAARRAAIWARLAERREKRARLVDDDPC
jgi:hypothetical protein